MAHPYRQAGGTQNYRAYNPVSNRGGYAAYDNVLEQNSIGHGLDTANPPIASTPADDKWERFFGAPPYSTWMHDNYSDLGHENYQLPTAYIGRNLHIEKLLNVSIASTDDFYTRVLLPWKVYDGMKITFSRWNGFDHLMYQIPEEVPAPQIMTKFESGEAYQQRYGLAFKMEHGFQRTEMGRQAYTMNLQIITQSVLRTVYSRIMQVLVHNQNFLQVLANKFFPSRMALAREVSKTSVNSFGCMQKDTFGIEMVLNGVQKLFEARQIQAPDAIVLPHGAMAYMSLAKPERRIYALCGALAERLELDPKRELAVNVFGNNLQVFEHRNMNVSDSPHDINILSRTRDVGNVWRLFRDPQAEDGGKLKGETCIRVIDHDKQRWAPICLSEALMHCGVWNFGGAVELDGNKVTGKHVANASGLTQNTHPLMGKDDADVMKKRCLFGDLNCLPKGHVGNKSNYGIQLTAETVRDGALSLVESLGIPSTKTKAEAFAEVKAVFGSCMVTALSSDLDKIDTSYVPNGEKDELNQNVAVMQPIGASMEDLVGTFQDAIAGEIGGFEGTEAQFTGIAAGITDILSKAEDWSDRKRYLVAEAIKQHSSDFAKSASKLEALKAVDSADAAKSEKATADYVKALGSDFKSKWSRINATQKSIGAELDAAAPIGKQTYNSGNKTYSGDSKDDGFNFLTNGAYMVAWVQQESLWPPHVQGAAIAWLYMKLDLQSIAKLDEGGIVTPFGAFVFRPFQSFNMGSAVVMKSGNDTGFTAVGNSDFQLGDNVTNKTHLGHFTFYFEPVVHEPNHIMIARDVIFQGYYGGAGTNWFATAGKSTFDRHRWSSTGGWDQIVQSVQNAQRVRPSLLSALAFHHESKNEYICDPMSFTGRFHKQSILNDLLDDPDTDHYASAPYYRTMLGKDFDGIDDTTSSASGGVFHSTSNSGVCYQGLQCKRDGQGKWEDYTENTGHLGRCESLDSSLVWSGQIATKTSVSYERASNSVSLFNKST